eukprot:COSAG06_NODE_53334_length_300_cov_1.427861_1_plen_37_part_10
MYVPSGTIHCKAERKGNHISVTILHCRDLVETDDLST